MASLLDFREATIGLGEVLLGNGQPWLPVNPLCREFMRHMGIQPAYTPPKSDCTDVVSPVDHVGQTLKLKIARRHDEAAAMWGQDQAPSDSQKRIIVATWASKAWEELLRDNKQCTRSAFVKTGFLVAKDGSENHIIGISDGGQTLHFLNCSTVPVMSNKPPL